MWVATVDFMKAFDSIKHQSLWKAFKQCGIESQDISFLRRLFAEQKGTVSTDKENDMFEIKRGTKKGDLLSSLLFNTVLQIALKDDVERWQNERHGHMFLAILCLTASQTSVLLTTCSCSLLRWCSSKK